MSTNTESPVEKAMREAKEKAANAAPIETGAVSTQNGVTTYGALTPQKASLATLTEAGMNVDHWLKVNGSGIAFDTKQGIVHEFKARLTLGDLDRGVFYGVRYGDPAIYKKSFDRVNCVQGGSWPDALALATKVDQKCQGEYIGVDLQLTAVEDIVFNGNVLVEAGKRMGYSTTPTGGKGIAQFVRETQAKGIDNDTPLIVKVKHVQRQKAGVTPWGVLDFELVEVLEATE